jgi:hypothetical protein
LCSHIVICSFSFFVLLVKGFVRPNVRGGDWFASQPYREQQQRLRDWLSKHNQVVVLEIGAGFNTPVVTRWPAEAVARLGSNSLVRINPQECFVPRDLSERAVSLCGGWETIREIVREGKNKEKTNQIPRVVFPDRDEQCLVIELERVLDQLL